MKKITSILLTIAIILTIAVVGVVPSYAVDIKDTDVSYSFNNVTKILTFSGTGAIPDYDNCYDKNGNYNSDNSVPWKGIKFTSIEFGEGITGIGNYAFCRSAELTSVTIPDTVTSMGKGVFYDCEKLESVTISNEVTVINESTFVCCSSLVFAKLPDKLSEIKESAFYKCSSLEKITLPDTLISIGDSAFDGTGLTELVCPAELTSIGIKAFSTCSNLESITFNEKLTKIGDSAFRYAAIKKIEFPGSLDTIQGQVCADCKNLEEVIIPESVTIIQSKAFLKCTSLKEITIPYTVGIIGDKALGYASTSQKVENFKISGYDDVTVAKEYADKNEFEYVSLGHAYDGACGTQATWKFDKESRTLTISGKGAMANYTAETLPTYSRFTKLVKTIVIEDGIATIGNYAFYGFENPSMALSEFKSIVRIGNYALYNVFDSIYIPSNITSIGEKGVGKFDEEGKADESFVITGVNFSYAKRYALENGFKFVIDDTDIANEGTCGEKLTWKYNKDDSTLAFSGEGEMTDYTVEKLPEYLYHYISGITIEPSVTSIGDCAFIGADSVKELYLSPAITTIGEKAVGYTFNSKNEIIKIDDMKIVGYDGTAAETYATENEFEFVSKGKYSGYTGDLGETATWTYNEKLKTLTISGTGETISFTKDELPVFAEYYIEKVVIEEGITKIGDCGLLGLDKVKEITVANSVESIGDSAIGFIVNDSELDKIDGLTIKGYDESQAQLYAVENKFLFESLGKFGVVSGKCGEGVEWTYNSQSKSLTLTGTGATNDYSLDNLPEFSEFDIDDITIEDGITYLGDYIFVATKGGYDRINCAKSIERLGEKTIGYLRVNKEPVEGEDATYDCIPMEDVLVAGYLVSPVIEYAKTNGFDFETSDEDRIDFGFESLPIKIDQNSKRIFVYSCALDLEKVNEDCDAEVKSVELKTGGKLVLTAEDKDYEYAVILVGDANADSAVNSSDALEILQHTVGIKTLDGDFGVASDMNNDENINSSDALCALQVTVGIIKLEDLNK